MTTISFLRHARTSWNDEGRLTGRADIPLSPAGREEIACLQPPAHVAGATWHVSPLRRARETAALLGAPACRSEQRLIEMDFGDFEGKTLSELRTTLGSAMSENEARGLDFQPPGGESPRMVQSRLLPFLRELAANGGNHVAVCHKSVIRCVVALAFDWPMQGRAPVKLQWDRMHRFLLDAQGHPCPDGMNIPLEPRSPNA